MTVRRFGNPITVPADRLLVQNPAPQQASPPIQINRWVRNGLPPNAEYESLKNEQLNQAAIFRTKTYFNFVGHFSPPIPASTAENYWRAAFRTGPLAFAMQVSAVMTGPRVTYANNNSFVELKIYTADDESGSPITETFYYGPSQAPVSATGWKYVREFSKTILLSPNTDYYALIRIMEGANPLSVSAFELGSMVHHHDGYMPQNIGAHEPIVDSQRQTQRELLADLWEGTDPNTFCWSTSPGAYSSGHAGVPNTYKVRTSSTGVNILDCGLFATNSTTVTANTPGWKPDMRNKSRALSQPNGVPCVMKAFGVWAQLASPDFNGGIVELKNSAGAVVASITGWTTTPEWRSVSFNLPATHAKYDVHFRTLNGSQFSLWAVSIYPVG